jgi:hypothetical protein
VQNSDCVISSDSVDHEITKSSEVQQLRVELYRVNGSDYRISNCDTVDGSNCKIVNGVNVRASGRNSLYPIRGKVTCRALYTQHVTIHIPQFSSKVQILLTDGTSSRQVSSAFIS